MTNFINYLISAYIVALCYVIGAFINWDGNPGNWTEDARFCVFLMWALINICWAANKETKL